MPTFNQKLVRKGREQVTYKFHFPRPSSMA